MEIGRAIKEIRNEKGISQNKLSKLTGFNRGYLYKLESDLISPSLETLEKIAKALDIQVSEIVKWVEQSD